MKKKTAMILLLVALALLICAAAQAQAGYEDIPRGTIAALEAAPNQKLALRTGPGTKYSEVFSIAAGSVEDFVILQKEQGGSALWGMVEFTCRYGRYRAYTGMKRIDTKAAVPYGNVKGMACRVGAGGAWAYYGPGQEYVCHDTRVPAGTAITVYHEENGYVMADFIMPGALDDQYDEEEKQLTRAWISAEAVSGYDGAGDGWWDGQIEDNENEVG